jgi:hypothetical protein
MVQIWDEHKKVDMSWRMEMEGWTVREASIGIVYGAQWFGKGDWRGQGEGLESMHASAAHADLPTCICIACSWM